MRPTRLAILQTLPGLNFRIWLSSSLALADGGENSRASLKPPTLPDLRLSNHQAAAVVDPTRLRRCDLSSQKALAGSRGSTPDHGPSEPYGFPVFTSIFHTHT